MKQHKTATFKEKIVEEYDLGASVIEIGKRYKLNRSTVYNWIKSSADRKNQIKSKPTMEEKGYVMKLIQEGTPIKEICRKYDLKKSTVYDWMKQLKQDDGVESQKREKYVLKDKYDIVVDLFKRFTVTNEMILIEQLELIQHLSQEFDVKLLCDLFQVNRSTYYKYVKRQLAPHIKRDEELKKVIKETHNRTKKIASPQKIKEIMATEGIIASEHKVRTLMKQMGLSQKKKMKVSYIKKPKEDGFLPNLLNQDFHQPEPNLVWVSDITEIKINHKPVYLCGIMDLFSRKIIAHEISKRNNTRLLMNTIKKAEKSRKATPTIFHSDRGTQYTSKRFARHLAKNNILQSFSAAGYPYDNAVMESFFSHYKREAIYRHLPFDTVQEYIQLANDYMEYYNNLRPHKGIGMLTPNMRESIHHQAKKRLILSRKTDPQQN